MEDLLACVSWFLSSSWDFFTEITVPGLGVSFAALLVSLFLGGLGLRFLLMILGSSFNTGGLSNLFGKDKDK